MWIKVTHLKIHIVVLIMIYITIFIINGEKGDERSKSIQLFN